MLRHPKPATSAYFATRVFAAATLLQACLAVSLGGNSDLNAQATTLVSSIPCAP